MLKHLATKELTTSASLYADDIIIFCHQDSAEFDSIRDILMLFEGASKLHTSFTKCSVSPIACTKEVATEMAVIMECRLIPFPVKYLGIPLSTRRVTSEDLHALVDSIAD